MAKKVFLLAIFVVALGMVAAMTRPRPTRDTTDARPHLADPTSDRSADFQTARPSPVSEFASWRSPAGIPVPTFGLRESAPSPPAPWTSPVEGFYYVDSNGRAATDETNPYGSPQRPRMTIPESLPEGSVVEIHGTYDQNHSSPHGIFAHGTRQRPIFIRGASSSARPKIRRGWEISGSYFILENLEFGPLNAGETGELAVIAPVEYAALRSSELRGTKTHGGLTIASWKAGADVHHLVIIANQIHDNGDVNAAFDQDVHGIAVGSHVSNLWVVDNELARNSGDGIQINGGKEGQASTHHIWVGRNIGHHNKQTGFWTKQAVDVVFSENLCYGHRAGNSSYGQCMGSQYAPERVWFLFNHIHDCDFGIGVSSDNDLGTGQSIFVIGNVIHDIHRAGPYNDKTAWSAAGVMLAGGLQRLVANNTIFDVDSGINSPGAGSSLIIGNIVGGLPADRGAHLFVELQNAATASFAFENLFIGAPRIRWGDTNSVNIDTFHKAFPNKPLPGTLASTDTPFVNGNAEDFHLRDRAPSGPGDAETMKKVLEGYEKFYGAPIAGDARVVGSFSESALRPRLH